MSLIKWLFSGRSARSVALSLYKSGLKCTKKNDPQGAMKNFTAAVESPGAPEDLRAMALYNRALLFAALDKFSDAVGDLNAVLAMADPLREIKLAARRRLDRMRHQQSMSSTPSGQTRILKGSKSSVPQVARSTLKE
jgi:hypothetical protein